MTQNDFNSAFARQMSSDVPPAQYDPRSIAHAILRQQKWQTRIFAGLSIFFWLIATGGMLLLVYGLNRFIIFVRTGSGLPWNPVSAAPTTGPLSQAQRDMFWGTELIHHTLPYIAGSVVALMLAALFTVLLVFSSRRATLMRINLSLMQISEELKQMRNKETP